MRAPPAGKPFADPVRVRACGVIGPTGVDTYTVATVEFPGGIIAELVCGITCQLPIEVSVTGTKGRLSLPNPWLPTIARAQRAEAAAHGHSPGPRRRSFFRPHERPEASEIVVTADRDLYAYEADTVDRHSADRMAPAMSWEDSLGNMQLLDRWREEIGLTYDQDAEE